MFSVQYVPACTALNLFPVDVLSTESQNERKKKLWAPAKAAFDAASRHNWTPRHIILHKCQGRRGQGDPVHLNWRAQNIVRGSQLGRASQTVPSDLQLKLDQLHTSLPSHTEICPLFFYLFNGSVPLPLFTLCQNTLCHNSSLSLLLWNWISYKSATCVFIRLAGPPADLSRGLAWLHHVV